jgi:FHS family glucose/mannose:H+ symporter-like MFS transporter
LSLRGRIVLNGAFSVTGAMTNLLGPLLLLFVARQGLSDARAGRLFLAQFVFSSAGAASLGWIGKHLQPQSCLALSYLAMGGAVIALSAAGPLAALACVAGCGFAIGVNNPAANLVTARGSPGRETAALNLLSMCWSAGAVAAPPSLTYLVERVGPREVLAGLGSLGILAGALSWNIGAGARWTAAPSESEPAPTATRRAAWLTGLFLFLYIGAESTCSGWLPTYSWRSMGFPSRFAGWTQAAFWAAVLGGRLLASARPRWASPRGWIARGLAAAVAGNLVLVAGKGPAAALAGALLAGAGMAPLFPTAVAIFQQKAAAGAVRLTGYIFAGAAFGGAVIPWLVGVLSWSTGSMRAAMLATLGAAAGMILLARRL